jgi:hypothetical protein
MGLSDINMDEVTDTLDTLYAMREEVSEEDHPAAREKMYARNRALEAAIEVIHERFDIPGEPFSVRFAPMRPSTSR